MQKHTLSRRGFLRNLTITAAAATLARPALAAAKPAPRPNIIVILADDMGYSDIGCYGSEIDTPVLDGMAKKGVRFTHFYNTARCCPTRASLMSGLYPHQAGIGHMMDDRGLEGFQGDLNNHCVTIAEVMKTAGYSTYMAGKWHVTKHVKSGPKDNWPRQRGYDRFYGTIHGAGSFYDPNSLSRDNDFVSPVNDPEYKPKDGFYYTDAISDHGVRFIKEHDESNPFFMYMAYTAAHWPMHARPRDIAKYKGRYKEGWDALRAERYKKMIDLGVIEKKWALSPSENKGWENEKNKPWMERRMEVYAAMVDSMDQGIGKIINELKRRKMLDNTLVFFMQDNGGCAEENGSRGPITPDPSKPVELKPMKKEEFQVDMIPKVTRDGRPLRRGVGVMPGPADTYVAYGKEWANVSNTPFRMYKHWVHEGGISTPLIAQWPKGIKARGELRHQPGHLIDIMTTCVDVSGATYPKTYKGNEIHPMEGRSLVPAFDDKPIQREALYWEHEGNRAVRKDNWKLVAKGAQGKWELYDIEADRSELHDLSEQHPKKKQELITLWTAYANRAQVLPWPWAQKKKNAAAPKKKTAAK